MAGDWIKMRTNLLTHPKVIRILSALKADKYRVVGGLHAVWCLFDTHSTDGRLEGYTPEVLDDHLGWPGFSAEMIRVNWLIHDGESLATPRFQEHNGQSAKRRATDAERKRMARESGEMSASDADKKRTREEKRREEIKTVPKGTDGGAVLSSAELTKAELWAAGKSLLSAQGMPEKQCGSFVGKLVKDYGDGVVIDAVRAAVIARPADAAEYLKATCQHAAGQRQHPNKQEALEASNNAVAARFLESLGHVPQ